MRKGRKAAPEIVEKAAEIKDAGRELADVGGDAVRDFVSTTGTAARDFATATASAAKDLLDATEKAIERMNKKTEPSRRGRRVLKTGLALGVASALLANEKARGIISGGLRRLRGGETELQPWERPSDGEIKQTAPTGINP